MKPSISLIHQVHRRLLKRHLATGDRGLLAVGLGWAAKDGRPDAERGLCVVYFVRRKKRRLPAHRRIRRQVHVFLTRGRGKRRRRYRVALTTDVVVTGPAVLTGIGLQSGVENFTGGALVSWPKPSGTQGWGLISVGHAVANATVQVNAPGFPSFYGTARYATTADDNLDASFIELDPGDVTAKLAQYLPAPGAPRPATRPLDDLVTDGDIKSAAGVSLRIPVLGPVDFTLFHYFPAQNQNDPLLPDSPNAAPLLAAHSDSAGAFVRGTSGSVWRAQTAEVFGLQIGGFPDETDPVTGEVIQQDVFKRGLAQPMESYLKWAQVQTGSPVTLVAVF